MSHAIDRIQHYYGLRPNGIVHVGANNGQEVPAYIELGIRPVILIEPLDDPLRRLRRRLTDVSGFYPVQACCAAVTGDKVEFRVASNGGQSSSLLAPKTVTDLYPRIAFDPPIEMETITLDDVLTSVCSEHGLDRRALDYLALDTQGSEMQVLRGASTTLDHVRFVWTEVSFGNLYEGDTDVYDTIGFMRSVGFDVYFVNMNSKRWGDALFIRKGAVPSA